MMNNIIICDLSTKEIVVNAKKTSANIIIAPKVVYETLQIWLQENPKYNTLDFIKTHISLINWVLNTKNNNSASAYAVLYKKFDKRNVTKHLRIQLDAETIKYRSVANKDKGLCATYGLNLKSRNELKFVSIIFTKSSEQHNEESIINNKNYSKIMNNPYFTETLKRVELDIAASINAEQETYYNDETQSPESLLSRLNAILEFNQKLRYAKLGKKVNRIYSTFTMLSNISRKFLYIETKDGKKFSFDEVDIKTAQPKILIAVLKQMNMTIDKNYIEDACFGDIYTKMLNMMWENGYYKIAWFDKSQCKSVETITMADEQARNKIKPLMFQEIFFGCKNVDNKPKVDNQKGAYRVISWCFKKLYPKTFASIMEIKKSSQSLATLLQNMEIELWESPAILPELPFFTVHDAIYYAPINDEGIASIRVYLSFVLGKYNQMTGLSLKSFDLFKFKTNDWLPNNTNPVNEIEETKSNITILNVPDKTKQKRNYKSRIDKETFIKLHTEGKTRDEIAAYFGVSIPMYYKFKLSIK